MEEKKNTQNIINIALALAVVALFILHFTGNHTQTAGNDAETGLAVDTLLKNNEATAGKPLTIVYVNIDSLHQNYLLYEDLINQLRKKQEQYQRELDAKMKAFEKEVINFQETARFMSQTEGQLKQAELQEKEQKLYEMKMNLEQKFAQEEVALNNKLMKSIYDYLEEYNKEKQYDYILGHAGLGNILLANKELDITKEVVDGLNAKYKAEQAKQ
jgi:outer membrane protein